MKNKTVLSLSGGLDSATALGTLRRSFGKDRDLICVSFFYGSKHNQYELNAADKLATYYGVSHQIIDISETFKLFRSDLLNSGGEIPEGHYEAESMRRTVVPCRNLIFASILAGIAESNQADFLYLGVHAGDHHIYPDCRPEFIRALKFAVAQATNQQVSVEAPFLYLGKGEIVRRGLNIEVPYHLTRTCYKDQPVACGRCGSCQERLLAFQDCQTPDPLEYESREILPRE